MGKAPITEQRWIGFREQLVRKHAGDKSAEIRHCLAPREGNNTLEASRYFLRPVRVRAEPEPSLSRILGDDLTVHAMRSLSMRISSRRERSEHEPQVGQLSATLSRSPTPSKTIGWSINCRIRCPIVKSEPSSFHFRVCSVRTGTCLRFGLLRAH